MPNATFKILCADGKDNMLDTFWLGVADKIIIAMQNIIMFNAEISLHK